MREWPFLQAKRVHPYLVALLQDCTKESDATLDKYATVMLQTEGVDDILRACSELAHRGRPLVDTVDTVVERLSSQFLDADAYSYLDESKCVKPFRFARLARFAHSLDPIPPEIARIREAVGMALASSLSVSVTAHALQVSHTGLACTVILIAVLFCAYQHVLQETAGGRHFVNLTTALLLRPQ